MVGEPSALEQFALMVVFYTHLRKKFNLCIDIALPFIYNLVEVFLAENRPN